MLINYVNDKASSHTRFRLLVKFVRRQKLHVDFQPHRAPNPTLVQESTEYHLASVLRTYWGLNCTLFSIAGAFFLYAGFAAVGLLFIYGCLPETKGKKLEEIESLFDNRLCTCGATDSDEGRYIEYIRVKGSNYHLSDNDASDVE